MPCKVKQASECGCVSSSLSLSSPALHIDMSQLHSLQCQPLKSKLQEPKIEKKPIIVQNNLGISDLWAFIEASAVSKRPAVKDLLPPLSPVDAMLFGPQLDLNDLHPLVQDLYKP